MKVKLNKSQYDYLKENNILDSYKRSFKNYHSEDKDFDFSNNNYFITHSFVWDGTEEGHAFWKEHNNKSYGLKNNDLYTIEF